MNDNVFVVSPTLHHVHLLHHSDDGLWIRACALRIPVCYVELGHLMAFSMLK